MSDQNKKILLVLFGVLLVAGAFFLIVRPKNESIKSLKSDISELQARYDDLCEKEKHKDEFLQETADFNEHFDKELLNFPADLNQESTVMFLKGVEEAVEFENVTVSLPRPSTYYVLGQGSVADGATVEEGDDTSDSYVVEDVSYGISYSGSYDGFKDYLKYIADYKYRMNISSIDIVYAEDAERPLDECVGTVTLNAYSISGPNRTPEQPSVSVDEGKDVIFQDINGGSRASTSFDDDEGASIVSDHDMVFLLNNADNDSASGIIVASSESDEKTYVTSNENDVEKVDITVTSEDDKKYVEYSIGSNKYRTELLDNNLTIYVKSSSRVNSDDKNGVDVSINNDTDVAVYVKVVGDDSSDPRFNISKKTGVVKVY